jgi:hypothetical protein
MVWKTFRSCLLKNILQRIVLGLLVLFSQSCGIYNFTGASLSPDVKTMSVLNFTNETGLGPPRLAQNFTEKVRDYFQSNSTVRIIRSDGDLRMEGAIVGYTITPVAPTGTESASLNRLTMRVKVQFENTKDTINKFNQEFNFYGDYDQKKSLSDVENDLIETISNQIIYDIFNKALSNW